MEEVASTDKTEPNVAPSGTASKAPKKGKTSQAKIP